MIDTNSARNVRRRARYVTAEGKRFQDAAQSGALFSPTGKEIVLRSVNPNAGIEAAYNKALQKWVESLHKSLVYWITAQYRANPPEHLAQDAGMESFRDGSPANALRRSMHRLSRRWTKNFDKAAPELAKYFADKAMGATDGQLKDILSKAGFTVKFKMTAAANDAYQATIGENIALIKSIASEHLGDVEGLVMRSVTQGRNLGELTEELTKRYDITKRRAALIARDQNNKATATINKVRQRQLGITQAKWMHSHAGKEPRPSHVAANGKTYDIDKGLYLDGEWLLPGQAINCLPVDSVIEFAAGCKKLWRRWYSGDLTEIVTSSGKTIKATPNHPILTGRGWLPIQAVSVGDYVVSIGDQIVDTVEADVERDAAKFSKIFDSVAFYIAPVTARSSGFQFHGDVAHGEVQTIDIDSFLPCEIDAATCQKICELFFTRADHVLISSGFDTDSALASTVSRLFPSTEGVIRGFSALLPLLRTHGAHADEIRLGLSSHLNASIEKAKANASPCCAVALGKLKLANAGLVFGDNQVVGELFNALSRASLAWHNKTSSADELGDRHRTKANMCSGIFYGGAGGSEKGDRVINKSTTDYLGHVYNLENELNWYSSNTYIVHNCRCTSKSIIPALEN